MLKTRGGAASVIVWSLEEPRVFAAAPGSGARGVAAAPTGGEATTLAATPLVASAADATTFWRARRAECGGCGLRFRDVAGGTMATVQECLQLSCGRSQEPPVAAGEGVGTSALCGLIFEVRRPRAGQGELGGIIARVPHDAMGAEDVFSSSFSCEMNTSRRPCVLDLFSSESQCSDGCPAVAASKLPPATALCRSSYRFDFARSSLNSSSAVARRPSTSAVEIALRVTFRSAAKSCPPILCALASDA
mmetsp:Transcript_21801/g.60890  ORF Transcript_21801/g.60890 Transcript_21801/m.60890 type:complete len:248 (-) Transcript_21801:1172-1915(-)